jgi:HK97 family phage major capsid protein
VPLVALRTMATTPGSKGGYLVGTDTVTPVDVLRPWSVVASAGVQMMNGLIDNVLIPRTTVDTTITWIGEPSVGPSEAPPTLGNVSMTPKTAIALVNISYQLLKQGIAAEPFIRALLLRAAGQALDRAYFAGAGGVEPLGLHLTPGIGTQSGTSLAHAGTLAMRKALLLAGAREEALRWVGAPTTQETLGGRQRFTDSDRTIWDDGNILGLPAHATKNAPAATLTAGDFSTSAVGVWGPGIRIDVDPSQLFASAGLVARVMLMCDVAFPRPEAFSVATSVT